MGLRSTSLQRRDEVSVLYLWVVLASRVLFLAWWGGRVLGELPAVSTVVLNIGKGLKACAVRIPMIAPIPRSLAGRGPCQNQERSTTT